MSETKGLVFKVRFNAKPPPVAPPVAPAARPTATVPTEPASAPTAATAPPTAARTRRPRALTATVVTGTTRLARMLALAHVVEREIEAGNVRDYVEASDRLGVSRARMTQIANLVLLSPEIQEQILWGKLRVGERDLRTIASQMIWSRQQR